jgi:beta-lactamase class A
MHISGRTSCVLVGVFALSVTVPALLYLTHTHAKDARCTEKYPLTSTSLDCEEYDASVARVQELDAIFNTTTDQYIAEGKATRISVWVRDLETRQWAASNEFETFIPASLMKVPLMIAYYKFAEIDPSILETPLEYTVAKDMDDSVQDFPPETNLEVGKTYSVERLIEEMITASDNNATEILSDKMSPEFYKEVLMELGIVVPTGEQHKDFVTAKSYANIFRILYNASYLHRDYSEKALALLTQSKFIGMKEPLPDDVVVAHKFGEREIDYTDGTLVKRELHDCGIVYKNTHHYSLCIMTEGDSFDDLRTIIEDLSKITYDNM